MKAIFVLGLVSLVVTFVIALLGAFPLSSAVGDSAIFPNNYENARVLDLEAVEEAGERFSSAYKSLALDIVSFQHDPSLERAEDRRHEFVSYAQQVTQLYQ